MPEITKAEVARQTGVSKAAVGKAVATHRLVESASGKIDTDLPVNAAWIASHKAGMRSPPAPRGATVAPTPPEDPEPHNLDTDKKRAQIALMRKQTERHALAVAEKKGELIPRDLERRKWSAFDAALKTNLRDFPRRSRSRLYAIAMSEGEAALERALEAEVSEMLTRILDAAKGLGLAE